jgi:3-hydroxyisobutyrate dehydrogenase-like beta-hydroxyacid dehydrogenase
MERIGFIGVGNMGERITLNLLDRGCKLTVFDIQFPRMATLIRRGAEAAVNPSDVARSCRIVCTSLPTPGAVKTVYLGDDGILIAAAHESLLIDFSTNDPSTMVEISEKVKNDRVDFLEAPLSGGVDQARTGSLTIFVSGTQSAFERAQPLLEIVGKRSFFVGKYGNASIIKLLNQLLLGINTLAAAETLSIGKKAGIDMNLLYEIVHESSGNSYVWEKKLPNFILPRKFTPGFPLKLLYKDLKLMTDFSREAGGFDLLCGVAERIYRAGINMGLAEEDYSSIVKLLEDM